MNLFQWLAPHVARASRLWPFNRAMGLRELQSIALYAILALAAAAPLPAQATFPAAPSNSCEGSVCTEYSFASVTGWHGSTVAAGAAYAAHNSYTVISCSASACTFHIPSQPNTPYTTSVVTRASSSNVPTYACPANSVQSGSSCSCSAGYEENSAHTACVVVTPTTFPAAQVNPCVGSACTEYSFATVTGWHVSTAVAGAAYAGYYSYTLVSCSELACSFYIPSQPTIPYHLSVATRTVAPVYSCPANSTLSGSTCTCSSGFLKNTFKKGCYQSETVDVFQVLKRPVEKQCACDNSIYPLTASKIETVETGLNLGGQTLSLVYDSTRNAAAASASVAPKDFGDAPSLGAFWMSSFHRKLVFSPAGFGAKLFRGDGTAVSFRYQSGAYITDADSADQLVAVTGGYRYTNAAKSSVETYNDAGQLTSLADSAGRALGFTYSTGVTSVAPAAGYLTRVTDQTGRGVDFEYALPSGGVASTDGRISRILNPSGQAITTGYDGNGNLTALTWEDGKSRQFLYENPSQPWALTGVVNENASRLSTFGYDSAGRAISTERAGIANHYSVTYGTPPATVVNQVYDANALVTYRYHEWQAPANASFTAPNGAVVGLSSAATLGVPVITGLSQPAGSGAGASTSASTYDASGNVTRRDDFAGQRSCYAYDSSNRETVRVDGLATTASCASVLPSGAALPAGSRKTETTWHADWRLPTKVSQPLLNRSLVYHGQPDPFNSNAVANCTTAAALPNGKPVPLVCKQVEQSKLGSGAVDPATPARTTQFTYDSAGRVLTRIDPNSRTTSYVYYTATSFSGTAPNEVGHTVGDLQTITNVAGHVTQFTLYDRAGRVKRMVDPKGVVTDTSYTPRGWISSVAVTPPDDTATTTSYTYDNAGQLTGVTLPDTTTMSYSYDAAHRLTGVTDAKGNSVTYTLDNAGNRTGEQVKDPQGNLQRNIARVYDALNRVQQVTGAGN